LKLNLNIQPGGFGPDIDPDVIQHRAETAMMTILEDANGYFADATPVGVFGAAKGAWGKNMTVKVTPTQVVGTTENIQPYLYYVVNGTKPARRNPGGFLVRWVDKKLTVPEQYKIARFAGMDEKAARSLVQRSSVKFQASALTVAVAFIIGRGRMKHGSKGNDFISPIVEQQTAKWERVLQASVFPA
jgi:hypothetical protein